MAEYTAKTIHHYEDMDYIRQRPNSLIPSRDSAGVIHMIWEYISNSMDELILRPDGGDIFIGIFRELSSGRFQIVIRDNGRGIPSDSLEPAYTKLKTSGKIASDSAYYSAGGQFGQGAKAGAALSTKFRASSKSYLESATYTLYLNDGKVVSLTKDTAATPDGVLIIFEPDIDQFFYEAKDFASSGYLDLVSLCKQLNIFNTNINFSIYVIDQLLPDRIWAESTADVNYSLVEFINSPEAKSEYLSSSVSNKAEYLFEIWKTRSAILFGYSCDKMPVSKEDKLRFSIRLFFTKRSNNGNPQYFVSVNNVVLPDKTGNTATITAMQVLRELISSKLTDEKYKQFVSSEYNFSTLSLAIGVMYQGAELSGTTKFSFKDANFGVQFYEELKNEFLKQSDDFWSKLLSAVMPDIQYRYATYYDVPTKKQDVIKIFMDLNFPKNFSECKAIDNDYAIANYGNETELFIVEGNSAGNINSTRDNRYQAVYCTRGKPYNAATRLNQIVENRNRLMKDPIYQDIMKILGITPNTSDFTKRRFGKIIIATDADSDGYHIRELHLNNLYIINPKIISSGMVWIANPPLYSIQISDNSYFYVRDKSALMDAKIKFIYRPVLDIKLVYNVVHGMKEIVPDEDLYRELCYVVEMLGDRFSILADQLSVPLLILEQLAYIVDYLYPVIDYGAIDKYFANSSAVVRCNRESQSMIISIGHEDYAIGLNDVGRTIINEIMPDLKKFRYNDLNFMVRSKYSNTELHNFTRMSPMQLYMCMVSLRNIMHVHRYKGLGEMETEHCLETIMDPKTRSLTHITHVGDFEYNYKLISKDDSSTKKVLLTHNGALTNAMKLIELRGEQY